MGTKMNKTPLGLELTTREHIMQPHTHTHMLLHSFMTNLLFNLTFFQASLDSVKQELEEQKAALRERNKELQKYEQQKRAHEKEKVDCSLKMKELEHKIAKFHKDSRDAAQRVSSFSL